MDGSRQMRADLAAAGAALQAVRTPLPSERRPADTESDWKAALQGLLRWLALAENALLRSCRPAWDNLGEALDDDFSARKSAA
jgi:hypothetical protein